MVSCVDFVQLLQDSVKKEEKLLEQLYILLFSI